MISRLTNGMVIKPPTLVFCQASSQYCVSKMSIGLSIIPDLVEPVDALERMGTDDERDQDATLISNYEKQARLRAINFDVALGLLEKSLDPYQRMRSEKS